MTNELSTFRLYLLRFPYLLIAVGMGMQVWPAILDPSKHWALMNGMVTSMLGAMTLLCLLGLRYPLQMLPLLFWEIGWKSIWLLRVALPLWLENKLDAGTQENAIACLLVVVVIAAVPWDYVFRNYLQKAGDRWGRRAPSSP